jgi:hypothetical protein
VIELHVFTNSTDKYSPSTEIIQQTVASFDLTFGIIPAQVWCDPNPNTKESKKYIQKLEDLYGTVHKTKSLSDGYVKAVKSSTSDYLFMLEHDWTFIQPVDSLREIVQMMDEYQITHLRFNKRSNKPVSCDSKGLTEVDGKFCWTTCVSNNPHIINRKRWIKEALPYVRVVPTRGGIEGNLQSKGVASAIYGPLNNPKKVHHLDGCGRKSGKK